MIPFREGGGAVTGREGQSLPPGSDTRYRPRGASVTAR